MVAYVLYVLWRSGGTAFADDGSAPGAILPDYRSYAECSMAARPRQASGLSRATLTVSNSALHCAHGNVTLRKNVALIPARTLYNVYEGSPTLIERLAISSEWTVPCRTKPQQNWRQLLTMPSMSSLPTMA